MNRFIPRPEAGPGTRTTPRAMQDRLEIVVNETAPAAEGRRFDALRRLDREAASECPHTLSMPWNDLVCLLTGDRLAMLRRLRSDAAWVSGTEQTAALEWAGLVRTDAGGRPSVPYREIVVRIPL